MVRAALQLLITVGIGLTVSVGAQNLNIGSAEQSAVTSPSGKPIRSKAAAHDSTTTIAWGSAKPISSPAAMSIRRKINRGFSPASSIRANQNKAASGSEPLKD